MVNWVDKDGFLYSQDLSNCTTISLSQDTNKEFLYSQDLSNCTTNLKKDWSDKWFLYSQDLSNCTTTNTLHELIE